MASTATDRTTDGPRWGFPLAPMSWSLRVLTGLLLLLAPGLLVLAVIVGELGLGLVGGAMGALYVLVWLVARPTSFLVTPEGLWVVFPLRRRRIPWSRVAAVHAIDAHDLWARAGVPFRVGVGGLWGVFGRLWTTRRGWFDVYASRGDGLVVVERHDAHPILITPADPPGLVAATEAARGTAVNRPGR